MIRPIKPNTDPIRVLLIDDDSADRQLAQLTLDRSEAGMFDVDVARDMKEGEPLLRLENYDVLLLDLGLPGYSGMDTLLRARSINKSIPIVVLTDLSDEQIALECLNNGAQDYLFKSQLAQGSLSRSIRYSIHRQQLHRELQAANQLLAERNAEQVQLCNTAQRFVENISHEFRTPLTVITEYVSLLKEGLVGEVPLDETQQRFLSILADRADDLNTMVDDMLDVSKLEAGQLSTWRKSCHIEDVLRHLRPSLESKAAIKEVELEFAVDQDLPRIYCDSEKIGRVLINLVVNAIKFCGNPGHVRVEARRVDDHPELVVSVSDNGPGISQEDQALIFGRFQQSDTGRRSSSKGFGLGLSIARELVDLNLGQMKLESELDRGSKFSFTVPLADPMEVTRRYLRRLESCDVASVAVLEVVALATTQNTNTNGLDALLNLVIRPQDLLYQLHSSRWLLLVPLDDEATDRSSLSEELLDSESIDLGQVDPSLVIEDDEVESYLRRAKKLLADANRNRPGRPLPDVLFELRGQYRPQDPQQLLGSLESLVDQPSHMCV